MGMEWPEIHRRLARDRNDDAAVGALERRVRPWAQREVWRLGRHVVEDVVADSCAMAVVFLDKARGPDTFDGFVRGYFLNAVKQARSAWGAPTLSLDEVDPPARDAASPPDPYERQELERCLNGLPERERRAVALRHLRDAPIAAVAGALGVREGNARAIVFRGLAHLRRCLQPREAAASPRSPIRPDAEGR
jgi:RNA polymerase sigma factor (sigma-70 family)